MKTGYIVSEFGGDTWEYYERPLKVFLSKENAEKYIELNSKEIKESSLSISQEEFHMALEIALDAFPWDTKTSFPELILKTGKFPEWSLEELIKTEKFIEREQNHWIGLKIEEIELCQ